MKLKDIITTILIIIAISIQFYSFLVVASASNFTVALIVLLGLNIVFFAFIPKQLDETLVAIIYIVVCLLTLILLIQFLNALGIGYTLPQPPQLPPLPFLT